MFKLILFFAIWILLVFNDILPQNHIAFKHLTINEGLSSTSVTCIIQDKKGFMWFGTQDGLNRYDGYNFKVFKNNPTDTTSLTDNFIYSLSEDTSGDLYIETLNKNFHKYNPASESFTVVFKDSINLSEYRISTVDAKFYEHDVIWSGGAGKGTGLERLDVKSGEITHYKHNPEDPSSLSSDKVYSIYRDHLGNLWVGTTDGLDRLDELSGKFFHFRSDPNNPNSLPDNWIWPIYEDLRGFLWLGTVKGGLSRFDPKTKSFTNYKNKTNDPQSLNDNWIFSIYEDRSDVIWIGTNSGGVNYFHPSFQIFDHYLHDPQNKNSLNDNNVLAMDVDSKGNYWIGTRKGDLDKFIPSKGIFYHYSETLPNKLKGTPIQLIYEDESGILWLGTLNGLLEFNPTSETYKIYNNNPQNLNSISDNKIFAVIEDSDGFIWIGTYGGGVNKLDRRIEKISRYQYVKNDSNSISSNIVWSITEANDGNLWMGTFGGGVDVFDKNKETFKHYKHDPNNPSSLSDNNILRIFQDSKNNIWIGTTKGLNRYISKTNSFKNYTEENGLANNLVLGILEDGSGNLWISTNHGLSRFNPQTEAFKNYYYQDGLQSNDFNQSAFAKDKKTGKLLFGGPNGFNVFDPSKLKDNSYVPPIVLTDYLRYNSDDEEGKPIIEKGIAHRDSILLTYKDNIITLQFSALSYYNNFDNLYKYKLVGFNDNWIQLGNNHTVTFTNLSPGDYNLVVTGSNNDAVWNPEGKSLYVEVLPPWWRTNVAYSVYIVSFLGFLYGIRKVEINRREQKARLRENQLRLKATEAEKRTIEIENERKTKELEEARQLQLSMLPKELPDLPNLEIAAFMRTATEVGGDYYDVIVEQDGTLNVAFGDATGHGLQAGTMVTLMKGFFTSDSSKLGIGEFMNHCSKMIKEIKLGRILMSFSFLKIDNSKLYMSSAGMPPLYYYNKSADVIEEIVMKGMPLGAMLNFPYNVYEKEVKSGDILLLLSDGIPEQMNKNEEMYDYPRIKDQFVRVTENAPNKIIEHFINSCDDWMGETIQADDITVMVIKIK